MRTPSLVILAVMLTTATAGPLAERGGAEEAREEITGTVEKADPQTGRIVVDGQTLFMPQRSEAPNPKRGDKVTFTYEEQGGKKVITSFRQSPKR
jgi:Cu/Ag efflux protein CusF